MSYTEKETQQMIARALDNYESSHADFHAVIEDLGKSFENFKATYNKKLDKIETVLGRGGFGGGSSRVDGTSALSYEHKAKFLAWVRKGSDPEGLRGLEIQASLSTLDDTEGGFLGTVS